MNIPTIYSPTVGYSITDVIVPILTNTTTVYTPTVDYGAQNIDTPLLTNTPVDYTPTVSYNALTIDTPLLTNIATDYVPTVSYNALTINAPLLTNTSSVTAPTINYNALTVNVPLVANINDLYMPTVVYGAQTVSVPLMTNIPTVYTPSILEPVRAFIGAEGYGSATPGGPANLWYMQSVLGAAIPGDVYDIYLYFKPPASNADLITGLCQILIVNLSKNTISFADEKYGVPMRGYHNYEIGRILTQSLYTGGFPTTGNFQMEYSGIQFWSCMPVI